MLIIEDKKEVGKKRIPIPRKAKETFKAMASLYDKYIDTVEGGKVLKSYASDKQYNKKGVNNVKNNGEKNDNGITVDQAKMRLHRQDKFSPNDIRYQLYGGELAKNILKSGISKARAVEKNKEVKPVKPTTNAKPSKPQPKDDSVKTPKGSVRVEMEAREPKTIYINESQAVRMRKGMKHGRW